MEYTPSIMDLFASAALGSLISALLFGLAVGLQRRGEDHE